MAGVRIRWRGVARAAAMAVASALALHVVPGLLRAPEPPPPAADVGLPKARGPVRAAQEQPRKIRRRAVTDAPAATAKIGTRTRRRRERRHSHPSPPARKPTPRTKAAEPPPEPVGSLPPPGPEYVPPAVPERSPTSVPELPPAPESAPGDGSEEFAPH
jgi:hypothetical protein